MITKEQQDKLHEFWDDIADAGYEIAAAVETWNEARDELQEKFEELESARDEANTAIEANCGVGSDLIDHLRSYMETIGGGPEKWDTDVVPEGSVQEKIQLLYVSLHGTNHFKESPELIEGELSLCLPDGLENDYYHTRAPLRALENLKDAKLDEPVTLELLKAEATKLQGLYEEIQEAIKRIHALESSA